MIIKSIQNIFRQTRYYDLASKIYHFFKRLLMRIRFLLSPQKYLHPQKPHGDYKSQFGQDFYLENLGLLKKGGVFLEVGCNHPVHNSNSYFLEKCLGWTGVSIDGIDFSKEFFELRKGTSFFHCLIDTKMGEAEFFEVQNVAGWEVQLSSMYQGNLESGKGFVAH